MPNHAPDDATPVDLSAEQLALVGRIARSYAGRAPDGWLRIVSRQECSVVGDDAGVANVRVVVVRTPSGLVQDTYRPPRDLHFETGDLLRDLASASSTGTVVLTLVVDRDGSHRVRVVEDRPRLLVGERDEESSRPVHDYLARHRQELEELARRLG